MHFGEIDDDRKDSTAPHITFRPQLGGHRQCGLAICTFHLGFSLGDLPALHFPLFFLRCLVFGFLSVFYLLLHWFIREAKSQHAARSAGVIPSFPDQ